MKAENYNTEFNNVFELLTDRPHHFVELFMFELDFVGYGVILQCGNVKIDNVIINRHTDYKFLEEVSHRITLAQMKNKGEN